MAVNQETRKDDPAKPESAPKITHKGYGLRSLDGGMHLGSNGLSVFHPALSLEVAQALINAQQLKGIVYILDERSSARFIRLPDGKLHDNGTGETYDSYEDYRKKNL